MTPSARNERADSEIQEMFRTRNQEPPRIIPVEEAHSAREEVLKAEKPKEKPSAVKQEPKKPAPVKMEAKQEKAVEPYWEPCGQDARKYHRWKLSSSLSIMLGWVISLFWWALRAGDATVRLACPIIIVCHLTIGALLLWAWFGK